MKDCVFCQIVEGEAPATVVADWVHSLAIVPLNPVVPGHILCLPKRHVTDALAFPASAAVVMEMAATLATKPCNLITSAGPEATQTVMHLHIHIVPRKAGDGLHLPWTGQA